AALTAQALATFASLTRQDPGNAAWQREFAEAQLEQAGQSRAAGRTDAARTQAGAALRMLEPLFAQQPDDRATLLATVGAKLALAAVTGDAGVARRLRDDAVSAMTAVKSGGGDPRLLALRAEALLALGRKAEAQPVIRQLWSSGYR